MTTISKSNQKVCTKCTKSKPLVEFGKHPSRKDGLQPWCNLCRAAHARMRYANGNDTVRKLGNRANARAKQRLADTYPDEFRRFLNEERKALGLDAS